MRCSFKSKRMTYNISAYIIYLIITFFITFIVGKTLHKNGIYFLYDIFIDKEFSERINNILLIGYYLLNIGYVAISISFWNNLNSTQELLAALFENTGIIVLGLGTFHYFNIVSLWIAAHIKNKKSKFRKKRNIN